MSPRTSILKIIRWYQQVWSPDHSSRKVFYPTGYCRYSPSCSQYSYEAIEKHGILKGSLLALWRIVRCNPWSKGGHDPVH